MRKIIFSALAVLVGAFVFVSCSKEAKLEKNIVGTWELSRYWDDDEEEWLDGDDLLDAGGSTWTYEFEKDGKGTIRYKYKGGSSKETFKYTITDDDRLTLKYENYKEKYTIEKLKGKTMVLVDEDRNKEELTKK